MHTVTNKEECMELGNAVWLGIQYWQWNVFFFFHHWRQSVFYSCKKAPSMRSSLVVMDYTIVKLFTLPAGFQMNVGRVGKNCLGPTIKTRTTITACLHPMHYKFLEALLEKIMQIHS